MCQIILKVTGYLDCAVLVVVGHSQRGYVRGSAAGWHVCIEPSQQSVWISEYIAPSRNECADKEVFKIESIARCAGVSQSLT